MEKTNYKIIKSEGAKENVYLYISNMNNSENRFNLGTICPKLIEYIGHDGYYLVSIPSLSLGEKDLPITEKWEFYISQKVMTEIMQEWLKVRCISNAVDLIYNNNDNYQNHISEQRKQANKIKQAYEKEYTITEDRGTNTIILNLKHITKDERHTAVINSDGSTNWY